MQRRSFIQSLAAIAATLVLPFKSAASHDCDVLGPVLGVCLRCGAVCMRTVLTQGVLKLRCAHCGSGNVAESGRIVLGQVEQVDSVYYAGRRLQDDEVVRVVRDHMRRQSSSGLASSILEALDS